MSGPFKNILVYVDGSEASISAAMYAIILAESTGASLTAVYIINTRALSDLVTAHIFIKSEEAEYQQDLEKDADRYLKHVSKLAAGKGLEISTLKLSGSVNKEIKNIIKEDNFDLLVIGGVSQIRSRRDEFYNEADRAMRSVSCPVLVVKEDEQLWDLFESL